MFLGGTSEEDAEETLKTKFGYNDIDIKKLKNSIKESYIDSEGNLKDLSTDEKLIHAVDLWIEKLQQNSDEIYQKNYPELWKNGYSEKFTKSIGQKYIKILKEYPGSKSMFSFVDLNGNIFKPASAKAPAKGIRGNIFDEKVPLSGRELYR